MLRKMIDGRYRMADLTIRSGRNAAFLLVISHRPAAIHLTIKFSAVLIRDRRVSHAVISPFKYFA